MCVCVHLPLCTVVGLVYNASENSSDIFTLIEIVIIAQMLPTGEKNGLSQPVSYTHLTLPTIYSV